MKKFLFLAALFLASQISNGQDLQAQYYQAYLATSLEIWKDGIEKAEDLYASTENDDHLLMAVRGAYGSVGTCFAKQDEDAAEYMLEKAEKLLKKYLKKYPESAEANALLAGVYGMKIGLAPMKGMVLGPKSDGLLEKARKADENCAMAQHQTGSSFFYTPSMFGGDVEKAVEHLEKAKAIHEATCTILNWEYLDTLALLGQAYAKNGEKEKAKTTYELALETEPEFGYVKHRLLPNLK